jgi:hypothetical protein
MCYWPSQDSHVNNSVTMSAAYLPNACASRMLSMPISLAFQRLSCYATVCVYKTLLFFLLLSTSAAQKHPNSAGLGRAGTRIIGGAEVRLGSGIASGWPRERRALGECG